MFLIWIRSLTKAHCTVLTGCLSSFLHRETSRKWRGLYCLLRALPVRGDMAGALRSAYKLTCLDAPVCYSYSVPQTDLVSQDLLPMSLGVFYDRVLKQNSFCKIHFSIRILSLPTFPMFIVLLHDGVSSLILQPLERNG